MKLNIVLPSALWATGKFDRKLVNERGAAYMYRRVRNEVVFFMAKKGSMIFTGKRRELPREEAERRLFFAWFTCDVRVLERSTREL